MQWNWIPQVFYDLVARVVPGAVVLTLGAAVTSGPEELVAALASGRIGTALGGFTGASLALIFSYVMGSVVGQLWVLTGEKFIASWENQTATASRAACLLEHNLSEVACGRPALPITEAQMPRVFVMQDHLRDGSEGEALRLLKLRAEERLCHVLVVGFALLFIVNGLILLFVEMAFSRWAIEVALILGIVACYSRAKRICGYRINGTCIAWLIRCSRRLAEVDGTKEMLPNAEPLDEAT
jgi:hypothetical protein